MQEQLFAGAKMSAFIYRNTTGCTTNRDFHNGELKLLSHDTIRHIPERVSLMEANDLTREDE